MKLLTFEQWAIKLLSLIPIIANGIHATQQDVGLGSKTSAAQDALATAAASAQVLLPSELQPLASGIASIASQSLASTVAALHNAGKPATA
jgi:hypothetical protein